MYKLASSHNTLYFNSLRRFYTFLKLEPICFFYDIRERITFANENTCSLKNSTLFLAIIQKHISDLRKNILSFEIATPNKPDCR